MAEGNVGDHEREHERRCGRAERGSRDPDAAQQLERLRLLEAVLASSADGVIVVDAEGRVVFMNEAGRRLAQQTVEEPAIDLDLRYPDGGTVPLEETPLERALRGETINDLLLVLHRPDGGGTYVSSTASPIRDEQGRIVGATSAFRDVAERRQSQRALEAARVEAVNEKNRLEAIMEALPVGVAILDVHGGIILANTMYDRVWAGPRPATRTVDDYAAYRAWWVDTGEPVQPEEWAAARAVQNGETVVGQFLRIQRFDGTRAYVLNSSAPILDAEGRIVGSAVAIMDVTESIETEEALRESEARFRGLFEHMLDGYAYCRLEYDEAGRPADFVYLHVNEAFERLTGLRDVVGRRVSEVIPGIRDLEPGLFETYGRVAATGRPERFEIDFKPLATWLDISVYSPQRGHFVAVFDNITERKRAEAQRERLLAELEATVEAAPAGVVVYDPSGRIIRMNAAAARVMGYSPAEMELPMAELFGRLRLESADGTPLPIEEFPPVRALRGERVGSVSMALHRGDRKIWIYDGAGPIRARDGTILGAVVSFVDITGLRELEDQQQRLLAENEDRAAELTFEHDRLRTVVDSIADPLFVCDAQGSITLANRAARDLVGEDRAGALHTVADYLRLLDVRLPDGRPLPLDALAITRALAGEVVVGFDEIGTHPRKRQRVGLSVSAAPLRTQGGRIVGAVSVLRDITERIEYDRLREQFISVAAHELKTPVTIMKGYAQALPRSVQEVTPLTRKMLEAIVRGADRIEGIVNDLLAIARLQEGRLELVRGRIDLPELVEEVVDRVMLTTTKHDIRVRGQPVVAQGDRDRLEQVLVNLLDNAIRYSPEGGEIDVEVAVQGGEAVVSVKDQGVGIPREKQGRIFQRFYRAHTGTPHDYGGMGVGLYLAREIVERHGGRMWFESEEGKGSTFYLALPL